MNGYRSLVELMPHLGKRSLHECDLLLLHRYAPKKYFLDYEHSLRMVQQVSRKRITHHYSIYSLDRHENSRLMSCQQVHIGGLVNMGEITC